ncbi:hypothetical protein M446_1361 [Methylobacterium sp. 4-46]|uniref:hypothetical protein n=1 Tax=unclassified Methylobacterium TaxID=2615210 RepID=UPI000165C62D|nr:MULTISPECIES: hypothetical protein [Methylobacterium]ACA15877.1 hypothetical protein M446_1361 [Methylobacterium sp. 4-46]WFT81603.1 hypothetical protein QA634_06900 [Methylobacterium nodulans]
MTFRTAAMTSIAPLLLAICGVTSSSAEPASIGGPKILVHGNYCGPGNNAPLPPIDALDAACARHDACTPSRGLPAKACNIRLEREATAIARDPRQPDNLRAMAGAVAAFAAANPSQSAPNGTPERVGAAVANIVLSGLR